MASEPLSIPVPICEVCWLIDHTVWEPESITESGQVLMRLKGVDIPKKYNTETVEICSECGGLPLLVFMTSVTPPRFYF
jgi:hypothetical protein